MLTLKLNKQMAIKYLISIKHSIPFFLLTNAAAPIKNKANQASSFEFTKMLGNVRKPGGFRLTVGKI